MKAKAEYLEKFEITRTIHSDSERPEQFLKQNAFFTWFLTLEQFKFEKIIGIPKPAGKVGKLTVYSLLFCILLFTNV